jgi:hypothetical protein
MTKRIWVKLYIEILDDPKMGRLTNHLWRRAVELFLLADKESVEGLQVIDDLRQDFQQAGD